MRFLRNVLATLVGLILFFGLLFLILGIIASSSEDQIVVAENSVLKIDLDQRPIVERQENEFSLDIPGISGTNNTPVGVVEIKQAIQAAKEDDNIQGIYLTPGIVIGGWAALREIRHELIDFKAADKFIVAFNGQAMTEQAYYLSAVADENYLFPEGFIEFNGLASQTVFLKELLEKIGVEPRVFRVGKFKGAVEPLTRTDLSEENRAQIESFLNSIYNTYLTDLAEVEGDLSAQELRDIADSMRVYLPAQAVEYGMVDALAYDDEVNDKLKQRLNLEEEDDEVEFISLDEYQEVIADDTEYSKNRVAVIVAEGEIREGKSSDGVIGGDTVGEELRKAREDDNVKAVVLRINSPGGSGTASEKIWREVELMKEEKPIIASMSTYAASGGYYMAMGCDTIVAQPNTITGSIGVFSVAFGTQELFNKLGLSVDVVKTGALADILYPTEPITPAEERIIQNSVEQFYETFVTKAAQGRGMSVENIKEIASGRVWTGAEAKERNLVDVLGNLDDAIAIAVNRAGLEDDDYRVKYYPEKKPLIDQILKEFNLEANTYRMKRELGPLYPYVQQIQSLQYMQGLQARLPFTIEIQ